MKKAITAIIGCLAIVIAATAYYFYGHHNCLLSRSYFLEKEIRDLLYFETHEPISYSEAIGRYELLLARIRFDNRKSNYTERYTRALRRTQVKSRASELFDEYARSSNATVLAEGWALFQEPSYKALEDYGFLAFYWNGQRIDDQWIKSNRAEQGGPGYPPQGVGSPDP